MRFSIITCTYNSVITLRDTIESVNAQTFRDFEHIFVDGGSEDGTLEMISDLAPGAQILHGVRGGISKAMNAGLFAASGEIVSHLHSDDFYANERVLELVSSEFNHERMSWAIGEFNYLVRGQVIAGSLVYPPTLKRLGLGNFIPHHSTFIRREIFVREGGFDERLKFCMDYELWFRMFQHGIPAYIGTALAVFRAHDGSVSTANRRKALQEELGVRLRYWHIKSLTLPRYMIRYIKRWYRNQLV